MVNMCDWVGNCLLPQTQAELVLVSSVGFIQYSLSKGYKRTGDFKFKAAASHFLHWIFNVELRECVCMCHTAGDSHADRQNKESLMSLYKPWAVEPDLWWLVWTIFPTICHLLKWANSPAVADGKLPRNVTFSCQRSTAEQWHRLCIVTLCRLY